MSAKPGTSKWHSVKHEDKVASVYGGKRSASSGGADHDQGDVRTPELLIEAKMTGVKTPAKSISIQLDVLEKICEEAYSEGKEPMLALRIRNAGSPLADKDGFVDIVARLMRDDIERQV